MSREIKFRMWDFENKEMIDGDSLAFEEYAPISHLLSQKGIMQYTGLKDKNGIEIYEGDIVKHDYEEGFQTVVWAEEFVTYRLLPSEIFPIGVDVKGKKMEVIGNIYANPELLGEDKHE